MVKSIDRPKFRVFHLPRKKSLLSEVVRLTWDDLKPHLDSGGKATVFDKESKTRVVIIPPKLWRQVLEFK